ncbi:MAG: site-specific integrase [Phycisphaerales bacterium]|nr:site-specific integrase [Phycisphaerales bacterium]
MRIGEAIHLTWDDVDFENGVILIRSGVKNGEYWQPKTKHGNRRIAIVPELTEILRRVGETNRLNRWVFETNRGTRLHPCNVQKRFREICDGLGFKKRLTVHSLRKYWASTVAQQGMPWQVMIKMFGHGDFKLILETYYAQNDDARLVAEAQKIDFGLCGDCSKAKLGEER